MQKVNEEKASSCSTVVVEKDNSLKAEPVTEYEHADWLAVVSGNETHIYDEDREVIDHFWVRLTQPEFVRYMQGLNRGLALGIQRGKVEKAAEVRRALGL